MALCLQIKLNFIKITITLNKFSLLWGVEGGAGAAAELRHGVAVLLQQPHRAHSGRVRHLE